MRGSSSGWYSSDGNGNFNWEKLRNAAGKFSKSAAEGAVFAGSALKKFAQASTPIVKKSAAAASPHVKQAIQSTFEKSKPLITAASVQAAEKAKIASINTAGRVSSLLISSAKGSIRKLATYGLVGLFVYGVATSLPQTLSELLKSSPRTSQHTPSPLEQQQQQQQADELGIGACDYGCYSDDLYSSSGMMSKRGTRDEERDPHKSLTWLEIVTSLFGSSLAARSLRGGRVVNSSQRDFRQRRSGISGWINFQFILAGNSLRTSLLSRSNAMVDTRRENAILQYLGKEISTVFHPHNVH